MPHGGADRSSGLLPSRTAKSDLRAKGNTAMSKVMVGVLVAIAISVGASAQASRLPAQSRAASSTALLAQVKVSASEFKFVLSKKTAKRGLVTFKVTNVGKISHDFQISGPQDEDALARSDRDPSGHVPAQGRLPVQVHGPRARSRWDERRLHDHLRRTVKHRQRRAGRSGPRGPERQRRSLCRGADRCRASTSGASDLRVIDR